MSDEHKLIRDASQGTRAKELLENEELKSAFATLERQYIEGWLGSGPRDTEGRERLFSHVQNLRKLQQHLSTVLSNGKLAEQELREIAQTAERKKRFGIIG